MDWPPLGTECLQLALNVELCVLAALFLKAIVMCNIKKMLFSIKKIKNKKNPAFTVDCSRDDPCHDPFSETPGG